MRLGEGRTGNGSDGERRPKIESEHKRVTLGCLSEGLSCDEPKDREREEACREEVGDGMNEEREKGGVDCDRDG